MPTEQIARWAYRLGENGAHTKLSWEEVTAWTPGEGLLWVHLDASDEEARGWLHDSSRIDPSALAALLATETRPRFFVAQGGVVVILRGVNLNPGAEPDDMIALRIWAEKGRLISLRHERLRATVKMAEQIEKGAGPGNVGTLLTQIVGSLTDRIEPVVENLEDIADALEADVSTQEPRRIRGELAEMRRQVIALRRYLAPQRLVLTSLANAPLPWLTPALQQQMREIADRTTRYVEDLEALRERAAVIHDELANRVGEQLNERMYVLSIVTTIFLPLGLLTGLLGINVGGMPGAADPNAFWLVCAILTATGVLLLALLRGKNWI